MVGLPPAVHGQSDYRWWQPPTTGACRATPCHRSTVLHQPASTKPTTTFNRKLQKDYFRYLLASGYNPGCAPPPPMVIEASNHSQRRRRNKNMRNHTPNTDLADHDEYPPLPTPSSLNKPPNPISHPSMNLIINNNLCQPQTANHYYCIYYCCCISHQCQYNDRHNSPTEPLSLFPTIQAHPA